MSKFLMTAVAGLLAGFLGTEAVSQAYAACELGCQESIAWAKTGTGCIIFSEEPAGQGKDGRVAGDIGTRTAAGGTIHWDRCPNSDCNLNCTYTLDVWYQAAGTLNQGCVGLGSGDNTFYECEED